MISFSISRFPSTSPSFSSQPSATVTESFRLDLYTTSSNTPSHSFEHKVPSDVKVGNFTRKSGRRVMGMNPIEIGDGGFGKNKKKGKEKIYWVCSNCGYTAGQWWGVCRSCTVAGTMKEFHESKTSEVHSKVNGFMVLEEDGVGSWLPQQQGELRPLRLIDINRGLNHQHWRIPLSGSFGNEVSRVLGGGLVPGSLNLVGGDPGVGKSTLLLQIAAMISEGGNDGEVYPVVYVSGEESVEQIGNRADRLMIESDIYVYSSNDIEDILKKVRDISPRALVVDSIQTVYLKGIMGSPGGIIQVKECTSALLRFAKTTNIPVLLIGHVNKSGDIAGPRVLEHIVDVVLYMEGEKCSSHRMLRAVKNRFGSTDELGIFEMSHSGLQAVSNASEMFLSEQHLDSEILAGMAVAVIMDGSRTFLIEIQALCLSGSTGSRQVNGIHASRADMIISVLIKQAGLRLRENAVYLNVVSGFILTETAGDLAVAASICSSFLELPIPNDIAFIGEIGLGGELRMVPRMEKRIHTVAKLGYRMCVVPKAAEKALGTESLENMKVVGCRNLKDVINTVFPKLVKRS
ncbi:putative DNA repair protein RadA [Lupinus albus]|uniref:Putative DNA repair protein RadA n=1 Tax=Lupinus albus TaxID=3870 RepID=A0A6A4QP50_LUPAL|nr:putative DNA repair protein RadA [Lupinus albus]